MITYDPSSRRVWVADRRCHHGLVGAALATLGLALPDPVGPILVGLGAALMFHDWTDRWWTPTRRLGSRS